MKILNFKSSNGLKLIKFNKNKDNRGSFTRIFFKEIFLKNKIFNNLNQINLSQNLKAGTFRGFHFQKNPHGEAKVITCLSGKIFLCLLDVRKKSKTYLKIFTKTLEVKNSLAMYVPIGFASAFLTLKDDTKVLYYMSKKFIPGSGSGINYQDPNIKVKWPYKIKIISKKDIKLPYIK